MLLAYAALSRPTPSVGTLAICASKLQHYGLYDETDANKQLVEQFLVPASAVISKSMPTRRRVGTFSKKGSAAQKYGLWNLAMEYLGFRGGEFSSAHGPLS